LTNLEKSFNKYEGPQSEKEISVGWDLMFIGVSQTHSRQTYTVVHTLSTLTSQHCVSYHKYISLQFNVYWQEYQHSIAFGYKQNFVHSR